MKSLEKLSLVLVLGGLPFAAACQSTDEHAHHEGRDHHDGDDHDGEDHADAFDEDVKEQLAALGYIDSADGQDAPQISEEEMWAIWEKLGATGEHHEHLAAFVGEWDSRTSMWMEPGAEAMVSNGSLVNTMENGGRMLLGMHSGSMMGRPHQGLSLMGYDNATGEYVSIWTDNWTTMISPHARGGCSNSGKTIEMVGEMPDPIIGSWRMRNVFEVASKDQHSMTMYATYPGMPEFKTMEIVYTRK